MTTVRDVTGSDEDIVFDEERDCSTLNGKQDIRVEHYQGAILIGQWDGAGEQRHAVVVPPHLVAAFRGAVFAAPESVLILDAKL